MPTNSSWRSTAYGNPTESSRLLQTL
jgi:hypothetical protein